MDCNWSRIMNVYNLEDTVPRTLVSIDKKNMSDIGVGVYYLILNGKIVQCVRQSPKMSFSISERTKSLHPRELTQISRGDKEVSAYFTFEVESCIHCAQTQLYTLFPSGQPLIHLAGAKLNQFAWLRFLLALNVKHGICRYLFPFSHKG